MVKPPGNREIGRNHWAIRCPICKQKGRPLVSDTVQPGDRLALALVGAVKEINTLGKRLKMETPGLTFTRIQEILHQPQPTSTIRQHGSEKAVCNEPTTLRADELNQYRKSCVVEEMVRAAEAMTEEKVSWCWRPEPKGRPRVEVTISLVSGCVKVTSYN